MYNALIVRDNIKIWFSGLNLLDYPYLRIFFIYYSLFKYKYFRFEGLVL